MAEKHFFEQKKFAREYLFPLLESQIPQIKSKRILEVGCAEAGLLDYLNDLGIENAGIELEAHRVEIAKKMNPELNVQVGDITDVSLPHRMEKKYDVIIMRDVIEHVQEREKAFQVLSGLLHAGGYLFITFPPRFSAFAGHQQHAKSFLKLTPFVHLLPVFLWNWIGKQLGENREYLDSVMNNYRIGLSIRKFEQHYRTANFETVMKGLFLLRPIFKYRMGTPIIKFKNLPVVREFLVTGCEYLLRKKM